MINMTTDNEILDAHKINHGKIEMVPVTYLGKEFVIVLIIFGFGIFIGALSLISGEVMEGKSVLFKRFGGVDAIPMCIGTTDKRI